MCPVYMGLLFIDPCVPPNTFTRHVSLRLIFCFDSPQDHETYGHQCPSTIFVACFILPNTFGIICRHAETHKVEAPQSSCFYTHPTANLYIYIYIYTPYTRYIHQEYQWLASQTGQLPNMLGSPILLSCYHPSNPDKNEAKLQGKGWEWLIYA